MKTPIRKHKLNLVTNQLQNIVTKLSHLQVYYWMGLRFPDLENEDPFTNTKTGKVLVKPNN